MLGRWWKSLYVLMSSLFQVGRMYSPGLLVPVERRLHVHAVVGQQLLSLRHPPDGPYCRYPAVAGMLGRHELTVRVETVVDLVGQGGGVVRRLLVL